MLWNPDSLSRGMNMLDLIIREAATNRPYGDAQQLRNLIGPVVYFLLLSVYPQAFANKSQNDVCLNPGHFRLATT